MSGHSTRAGELGQVQVEGLAELRRELKELADAKEYTKQLKAAGKSAAEVVRARAATRAAILGPMQAKAAKSLRSGATVKGGYVALGGKRYPYAWGAEFGARHDKRRRRKRRGARGQAAQAAWERTQSARGRGGITGMVERRRAARALTGTGGNLSYYKGLNQFQKWTGNQWDAGDADPADGVGYFLHPALRASYDDVEETYLGAIDRLTRTAFPDRL